MNVSPHISGPEYACPCCRKFPPSFKLGDDMPIPFTQLFEYFESIREHWGKPLQITSGYRCIPHNSAIGGEACSAHIFGLALDIGCDSPQMVKDLAAVVREVSDSVRLGWKQYLAQGKNLIHIDDAFFCWPRPSVNFIEGATW